MVTDPKKRENKGSDQGQTQNTAGDQSDELREEQLKDVAGGIDWQSYKERSPSIDDAGA